MSICNTGAMAQLASVTELTAALHAQPSLAPFLYRQAHEANYAVDTDTMPLGSGSLVVAGQDVLECMAPDGFDLLTDCRIVANLPAIVNVTSVATDLAGSATNASMLTGGKYRAYVDGPVADHVVKDRRVVARATTLAGTLNTNLDGQLPFASVPAGIAEGDHFRAHPTAAHTVTGTITFPADNSTNQLGVSKTYSTTVTVTTSSATPVALKNGDSVVVGTATTSVSLAFGSTYAPIAYNVTNRVTFGGVSGLLTFTTAGSTSDYTTAINGSSGADMYSFSFAYVDSHTLGGVYTLTGRVGRIDTAASTVYDRRPNGFILYGGVHYQVIFTRDSNANVFVGDSSVEVPASDGDVIFDKRYNEGPNVPAASAQGLDVVAAGVASDIAAYFQPHCLAQLVNTAVLEFSGVCADVITGTAVQLYSELFMTDRDRNAQLTNACVDTQVLKARARQPQQLEVKLPFGFFTRIDRAINKDKFKFTDIKLRVTTNPYSRMIGNGCGSSDFPLTITSANGCGGSAPCTLVTKAGTITSGLHAFSDSKVATTFASAAAIRPADIRLSVRWSGVYLDKVNRDRLSAMTTSMVIPQHAVSEPLVAASNAVLSLPIAGNNNISCVVVVGQCQSSMNQGRWFDFRGHALPGTGTRSGAMRQFARNLQSVRLKCASKMRTELLSGDDAEQNGLLLGATERVVQDNDYYCVSLCTANPYTNTVVGLNAQKCPDIQLSIQAPAYLFQDNLLSGGLNGKSKTAGAGLSVVEGGESVTYRAYTVQQNVMTFDGTRASFMFPR